METNKLCFVIMPFEKHMDEVYSKAIKPACDEAGFTSRRVNELKGFSYNINREIIEHIFNSAVIIADLTKWRPNVFYEMGVAHAIDIKTIMILQKKGRLPFDVSVYRYEPYEQTEAGLKILQYKIRDLLNSIEKWRNKSTNPVQDYKPYDAFVPRSLLDNMKNEVLANSVPKDEWNVLQNELTKKDAHISDLQRQLERLRTESVPRIEVEARQKKLEDQNRELQKFKQQFEGLQKELAQTQSINLDLTKQLDHRRLDFVPQTKVDKFEDEPSKFSKPSFSFKIKKIILVASALLTLSVIVFVSTQIFKNPSISKSSEPFSRTQIESLFRNKPTTLSDSAVKAIIKKHDFYCRFYVGSGVWTNPLGKGFDNEFELRLNGKVVFDSASGLAWQKSGASGYMAFADAERYVRDLNNQNFAGFKNWRLPTLEEAMSLMEPRQYKNLYIDPVFDETPERIWTADIARAGAEVAWVVSFSYGGCHRDNRIQGQYSVRAVCSL